MDSVQCLVCLKNFVPKVKAGKLEEIDFETADECEAVKKQLPTIFLLRKFLELPEEFCCKLLEDHGDPNLWTGCCDSHSVLVERGKRIFDKIALLQQQYKKLQTEFKASVISSFQSWEKETVAGGSRTGTTEIIRSYVKNGNTNPEISVPARNLRKRVETNTVNKEESDEPTPTKAKKPATTKPPPKKPASKTQPAKKPTNKKRPGKKAANNDDIVPFAGQGHKLSEIAGPSNAGTNSGLVNAQNTNLQQVGAVSTIEKKTAAAAALARLERLKTPDADHAQRLANRQRALIKEAAKREMEEENKLQEEQPSTSGGLGTNNTLETEEAFSKDENCNTQTNSFISNADRFTCPFIGPQVLPKAQMERKIREFLLEQPNDDVGVTCSLIHSLNKREKVAMCVETLSKYLDNIIENPKDMKYRKIRCANKVYQERVAGVEGAKEFLAAAGFTKETVENEDTDSVDEFWEFSTEEDEEEFVSTLTCIREQLQETEPLRPIFDRNVKVLKARQFDPRMQPALPADFFELTTSELKLEQQRRRDVVEQETTLRTKAQRERDLIKSRTANYRYCLIRIKLPDEYVIQGTFSCREKVLELYNFVRESLSVDGDTTTFRLKKYGEGFLDNIDATMAECGLSPSAVLTFQGLSVPACLATGEMPYLKSEILESALALP